MKKALTLLLAGIVGASAMVAPASASFIQEEAYYEVAFGVKKAAAAWAPDGTYTPGEYFDIAVDESWRSSACADDANDQTAFGLDYKLALSWDETYFYTYIQFTDPNGHDNTWGADPASMWYSGAIQINLADDDQMGESRLEYGVGLTSDSNQLISNVWADYLGSGFSPVANEDYIVTVDGDVVTYEARTPFTAFTEKEAKEGEIVSCCYVLSWGNGQDYCHTQLAEGCTGNGKDAGAFAMVTLEGVGDVSAAAAAPAASAASSSLPAAYPCSGTAVPADSVLIAGELIGMENGWDGTAASGRAAAFDGNIETFYDPATASVDWAGIDAGEEMILTKIMIHPRTTFLDRFDGATIEASNDPEFEESVEIFFNANGAASEIAFVDCTAEIDADVNTGYRYFRYINYMQHGDVAEVELYGKAKDGSNPTYGAAAATEAPAEAPAAEAAATDVIAIDAAASVQEYPSVDPIANSGAGYATLEEAAAAIGKTAITGYTFVSGTGSHANEGPENLWDNDTATKFCAPSDQFPTISIAALDGEYAIDGIIMATANDNAEYNQRSPYEWAIYGSKDGSAWTAIAYGDDYFYEETNFTYYAAAVDTTDAYKYIMFQSEGGLSGTFQVSEVAVTGTKVEAAAPVVEEPAPVVEETPVVEEAPAVEEAPVVEEEVVETPAEEVVEEEVEAPAAEEAVEEAPQTFDFGVIAVVAALVSAAGYALSKKR